MESFLFKSRFTVNHFKCEQDCHNMTRETLEFLEGEIIDKDKDYICTQEQAKNLHYHIVAYITKDNLIKLHQYYKKYMCSRGWIAKYYTDKELVSRQPAYYIGYTLKEVDPCVVFNKLAKPLAYYRQFYIDERTTVSDTFLSFMKEQLKDKPYDDITILNVILDYYAHMKVGYDKRQVNKMFHLVRKHLYPEKEKVWVTQNLNVLIE